MTSEGGKNLSQLVAFGPADFAAPEGCAHLVGFVADHKVPIRGLQFLLYVLVSAEFVETTDGERVLREPVSGPGRLVLVIGHDFEGQVEAPIEFILPLFDQVARADNEAPLQVAPRDQLLDQQPSHDGLSGPGIIGQKETKRLARKH